MFYDIGNIGLELLVPALSGLHHLDLSGCNLDTPAAVTHVAAALRACSSIKSLRFEDNVLGVEGAQALGPALQVRIRIIIEFIGFPWKIEACGMSQITALLTPIFIIVIIVS